MDPSKSNAGQPSADSTRPDSSSQEQHSPSTSHGNMAARGVTRPMAEQQVGLGEDHGSHEHQKHDEGDSQHGESGSHGKSGHAHSMSDEDRRQMLVMHHRQTLWVYWMLLILGCWMLLAPHTFGHLNPKHWVDPSGGRGAWFSDQPLTALRANLMVWSDLVCGLLLLVFGWRSLTPNRPVSLWICCFVGCWLTAAPVLFWAPTAAAYLNDTIVGALLIALTILVPGMPNMIMYMQMGPPTPPGWSYNPSSWPQRWIMIVTGFAGWLVSRDLAAFQLGYTTRIWEPFFGSGSEQVLNSQMSHMWPISDASLGAMAYTFEFLMGWMGSPSRWRTMPWMVALFGVLVIPLGLTHIVLVISQPVVVGHWCTLCLLAAAIMLPMIPLEVDEVVAMCQHLVDAKRRGDRDGSLCQVFWKGGLSDGCSPDKRSPELLALPQKPGGVFLSSIWGMSFPWTLVLASIVGIWLMFSPYVFGVPAPAAHIDHLGGALIVTVSVICMGEVVRAGRFLNLLLALIVAVGPWLMQQSTLGSAINGTICGIIVAALAIPRGPKVERYGLWDPYVW